MKRKNFSFIGQLVKVRKGLRHFEVAYNGHYIYVYTGFWSLCTKSRLAELLDLDPDNFFNHYPLCYNVYTYAELVDRLLDNVVLLKENLSPKCIVDDRVLCWDGKYNFAYIFPVDFIFSHLGVRSFNDLPAHFDIDYSIVFPYKVSSKIAYKFRDKAFSNFSKKLYSQPDLPF